jgi:hypothetical protein
MMRDRQSVDEQTQGALPQIDPVEAAPMLPVWLTREEVEALISMCATAPEASEATERELFAKLGQLYRAFNR